MLAAIEGEGHLNVHVPVRLSESNADKKPGNRKLGHPCCHARCVALHDRRQHPGRTQTQTEGVHAQGKGSRC